MTKMRKIRTDVHPKSSEPKGKRGSHRSKDEVEGDVSTLELWKQLWQQHELIQRLKSVIHLNEQTRASSSARNPPGESTSLQEEESG